MTLFLKNTDSSVVHFTYDNIVDVLDEYKMVLKIIILRPTPCSSYAYMYIYLGNRFFFFDNLCVLCFPRDKCNNNKYYSSEQQTSGCLYGNLFSSE